MKYVLTLILLPELHEVYKSLQLFVKDIEIKNITCPIYLSTKNIFLL